MCLLLICWFRASLDLNPQKQLSHHLCAMSSVSLFSCRTSDPPTVPVLPNSFASSSMASPNSSSLSFLRSRSGRSHSTPSLFKVRSRGRLVLFQGMASFAIQQLCCHHCFASKRDCLLNLMQASHGWAECGPSQRSIVSGRPSLEALGEKGRV